MKNPIIKINGTGCALMDFLYTNIDFNGPGFTNYLSRKPGDGGLGPGKLVFTEELENFAQTDYNTILKEITENKQADSFNIGGPGLVSLIHAAQLTSDSTHETRFFGASGDDSVAAKIFSLVQQTPLIVSGYQKISARPTSFTDVFSDPNYDHGQGERSFVNNIGAAWDYSPEMLQAEFFDASIVCFGGTALVPQIHDNLSSLLKKAKSNNCITVINTVFDFRNEKRNPGKPWPLVANDNDFQLIDVLIMDSEEALKISGKSTIEAAFAFFKGKKTASFIITNGNKELLAYSDGSLFLKIDYRNFPVSAKIVDYLKSNPDFKGDTTGCGDNFAGGIISSLAWQLASKERGSFSLSEALSWAVVSGGFACSYLGGTYFEKSPKEKYLKLKDFQDEYIEQLIKTRNE